MGHTAEKKLYWSCMVFPEKCGWGVTFNPLPTEIHDPISLYFLRRGFYIVYHEKKHNQVQKNRYDLLFLWPTKSRAESSNPRPPPRGLSNWYPIPIFSETIDSRLLPNELRPHAYTSLYATKSGGTNNGKGTVLKSLPKYSALKKRKRR